MTGSQANNARGFACLTRPTMSSSTRPASASQRGRIPSSAMPSNKFAISCAGTAAPRHLPYPVWFEKATVWSAHVSHPRRCSGKRAAVLPTLPQATQDWIDSTVGMSVPGWVHAVEHVLHVEKDDRTADDEERDPRRMHRALFPRTGDKQAGEADHREERDHERQVPHVADEQSIAPAGSVAVEPALQPQKGKRDGPEAQRHAAGVVAGPASG